MCMTWTDHEFGQPRFLESGTHESLGRYNRYVVRCGQCGRETRQTEWFDARDTISRIVPAEKDSEYGSR
jgi:hypothetical protein